MPVTPGEKFAEELIKMVKYWQIEFELEKFTVVGALLDVAVDVLFGNHEDAEDEEEDEE
tara:strand:+ start:20975 stop:21151 length:177 start_codon:yes stop_codon:yes gene_type:complete